jgi:hypothetical protein
MTRADRVLSTPPTNTPTDTNRRRFLSVAAGGAVAAALPVAALANEPDPIFATIERHRELSADYTAAVDISSKLEDGRPSLRPPTRLPATGAEIFSTTRTR